MNKAQTMTAIQNGSSVTAEDGGPRFRSESATGLMRFMDIVNTLTHLTLGAVAFIVIFVAILATNNKLGQHMILCVLGYVILMAQSILVMSPHNGWSRSIKFQDRKVVHLVMHIVGSILALTGCIIVIMEKNVHFDTTHGILGLVAMIFTFLSLIGGAIHLFTCMPRVTCLLHCVIGALTIIIAFLALIFGVDAVFRPTFLNPSTNTVIALIVISLIGTLLPSCFKIQKGCL